MDPKAQLKFWLDRWQRGDIAFHKANVNDRLERHWPALGLSSGSRVLVPMCGKSLDMRWLASQGMPVVGVELSLLAIDAFFTEAGEAPQVSIDREFQRWRVGDTEILQGDFFDLTAPIVGGAGAVYDRGALVALPSAQRAPYVDHLLRVIDEEAAILLSTVEYDEHLVAGPPYSVLPEEVALLYGDRCEIDQLESVRSSNVPPHFSAQGVQSKVRAIYRIRKTR